MLYILLVLFLAANGVNSSNCIDYVYHSGKNCKFLQKDIVINQTVAPVHSYQLAIPRTESGWSNFPIKLYENVMFLHVYFENVYPICDYNQRRDVFRVIKGDDFVFDTNSMTYRAEYRYPFSLGFCFSLEDGTVLDIPIRKLVLIYNANIDRMTINHESLYETNMWVSFTIKIGYTITMNDEYTKPRKYLYKLPMIFDNSNMISPRIFSNENIAIDTTWQKSWDAFVNPQQYSTIPMPFICQIRIQNELIYTGRYSTDVVRFADYSPLGRHFWEKIYARHVKYIVPHSSSGEDYDIVVDIFVAASADVFILEPFGMINISIPAIVSPLPHVRVECETYARYSDYSNVKEFYVSGAQLLAQGTVKSSTIAINMASLVNFDNGDYIYYPIPSEIVCEFETGDEFRAYKSTPYTYVIEFYNIHGNVTLINEFMPLPVNSDKGEFLLTAKHELQNAHEHFNVPNVICSVFISFDSFDEADSLRIAHHINYPIFKFDGFFYNKTVNSVYNTKMKHIVPENYEKSNIKALYSLCTFNRINHDSPEDSEEYGIFHLDFDTNTITLNNVNITNEKERSRKIENFINYELTSPPREYVTSADFVFDFYIDFRVVENLAIETNFFMQLREVTIHGDYLDDLSDYLELNCIIGFSRESFA